MTNEDLLDPVDTTFVTDGNLALDTTATETEEDSHVEETADEEAPAVDASEEPQTDSESPAGDPATAELPPWTPSAKLLEKLGELISNRQKIEQVRNQKKATNAAYKEREDALDARIGELTEQINEETWHEVFDFENGIVVRTNRLTGEIETRPYEPPRQAEIPWVDDRLRAVVVGQYGEDPYGNHYVVEKVDRDSVLVRYYDDGTRWVGVSAWGDYAPRKDVDQAEYEQAFSEEQASWTNDVLEAIEEEGATAVQIEESMFLGGGEQLARVQLALDRLESSRAVRVAEIGRAHV